MVKAVDSLRVIALLCYTSVVIADQLSRPNYYMNYPRQFPSNSSFSLPISSSSNTPPSSSSSLTPTASSNLPSSSSSSTPSDSPSSALPSSSSSLPPSNSWSISSSTSSSISSSSSSTSPSRSPVTSSPTGFSSGPTTASTQSTTTSTTPVIITVDWNTVSASTTSSVASATHDSNGWPIIPFNNCWFCLPGGNDGGGIIIPGVTGPGTIPPPPPGIASSLGFSSIIPSITLDSEGNPSYPSTEAASTPPPATMSTITRSSSSECTSTTTGYDYYVTCTASAADPLLLTTSAGCVTSTVTTTGCDITSTASTTAVAACPASVFQSVSSADNAQASSALTVVGGTTIPLAFYVDDTATPADFTVSHFGSIFTDNSTFSTPTPITTTSSTAISTTPNSLTTPASTTPTPSSSIPSTLDSSTPHTSSSSASPPPNSSTSPTSSSPISTTSAAVTPTATWELTAYDVDCDGQESSSDFSYYTLQGYSEQSPDEQCSNIQSGLPINSPTSDSCAWFTNGGFNGPNDCSQGTFTKPKSFVIRSGFCTIYEDTSCQGGSNGVYSVEYSGCTNVDDAFVDFDWNSISCFAIG
ncbi:hypothetical protein GQX73_g447 [Xylaria multiplex]|uniref:Secreted LysM effector LysM C-terminal domain-containing protein n=1 Tax=Xylaria multiplex TaxID=323545 RepID=A0A7C8N4P1_9PEZI|nr:hypothetical protein GQX73_g447 [Xylaria multiplex]